MNPKKDTKGQDIHICVNMYTSNFHFFRYIMKQQLHIKEWTSKPKEKLFHDASEYTRLYLPKSKRTSGVRAVI